MAAKFNYSAFPQMTSGSLFVLQQTLDVRKLAHPHFDKQHTTILGYEQIEIEVAATITSRKSTQR